MRENQFHSGIHSWRLPALEIEQGVVAALQTVLSDRALLVPDALAAGVPADAVPMLLQKLATLLPAKDGSDTRPDAPATSGSLALLRRVDLSADGMTLTIALPEAGLSRSPAEQQAGSEQGLLLRRFVPHRVRRRGVEMRLVIETAATPSRADPALVKALARAHCWFDDLVQGRAASALEIAHRLGTTPRYVQRLLPLALLAPKLLEDIVAGQHDPSVTAEMLTDVGVLPLSWDDQVIQLRG